MLVSKTSKNSWPIKSKGICAPQTCLSSMHVKANLCLVFVYVRWLHSKNVLILKLTHFFWASGTTCGCGDPYGREVVGTICKTCLWPYAQHGHHSPDHTSMQHPHYHNATQVSAVSSQCLDTGCCFVKSADARLTLLCCVAFA